MLYNGSKGEYTYMKITKYEHACVVIEDQGKKLIIDPGSWTEDFGGTENIAAAVITHIHADHFNPTNITAIAQANPNVQIFATEEVAHELATLPIAAVSGGRTSMVAPFKLQFFGEQHAVIHESMPRNQNVGVLVNDNFYYPGDSFVAPGVPVQTLALPVSAPWLKASEMMDFFNEVKPQICFPTHNALLSDKGQALIDNNFGKKLCDQIGATYYSLEPGESIEA
jgi:L-ascorbate metabolism protein UlaG (beta-lactamase superfamily)